MLKKYIQIIGLIAVLSLSNSEAQKPQIIVGSYNTGLANDLFVNLPFEIAPYGPVAKQSYKSKMTGAVIDLAAYPDFDFSKLNPYSRMQIGQIAGVDKFPPTPPLEINQHYALNKSGKTFYWQKTPIKPTEPAQTKPATIATYDCKCLKGSPYQQTLIDTTKQATETACITQCKSKKGKMIQFGGTGLKYV